MDCGTHLKIVVLSVIGAAIVTGVGIAARVNPANGRMKATVIAVDKPGAAAASTSASRGLLQTGL